MTYTTQEAEERGWFAKEDGSPLNGELYAALSGVSENLIHFMKAAKEAGAEFEPSGKLAGVKPEGDYEKPTLLEEVNVTYSTDSNIKNQFGG